MQIKIIKDFIKQLFCRHSWICVVGIGFFNKGSREIVKCRVIEKNCSKCGKQIFKPIGGKMSEYRCSSCAILCECKVPDACDFVPLACLAQLDKDTYKPSWEKIGDNT